MTDITTLILSVVFLVNGASRGLIKSILVPFSIIVSSILSVIYYQLTKDMLVSLAIGLAGPFLLYLLLKFVLKILVKSTNSEIKPSFLSRLGGALLTLAWGWVFIISALILLASMPPWGKTMTVIHDDVVKSASYFFAKPCAEILFAASGQKVPANTNVNTSTDTKTLAEDPRFQAVLQDPEIQKEIDAHDIVHLMSNPKMMELTRQIMSDPATMKKIMAIYSSQTASQSVFANPDNSK